VCNRFFTVAQLASTHQRNGFIYFENAAVAVDSSHMTASSSASWSRFSPPSNFVNGHVSTMWFMVCRWPQSQEGDWARPHYCKLARHGHFQRATHTHLTDTLCPGLPGWAGTRKVKPIWILLKQETLSGSGISWAICKSASRSRQTTTPGPHHSVFYKPDALPAAQPTVSKHWRHYVAYCKRVVKVWNSLPPSIVSFFFIGNISATYLRIYTKH